MMDTTPKTVGFVLKASTEYLEQRDVPNPRLTSEHLMARLLDCKRLDLYLRTDAPLEERYLNAMRRGIRRAADGEPTQYIVGQWEFMGRSFTVDRRALIPRPETETLVRSVKDCEALWNRPSCCIADVGTGSGCIVITLALDRPQGVYVAVDVSEEAIALARENATAHDATNRIAFVAAELPDAVEPESLAAVVSNPPYIPDAQYQALPRHIRDHEPRIALTGGADGLVIVRTVIEDAVIALQPGGFIFLEIGENQADATRELLAAAGFDGVTVVPDLAGKNRVVTGHLPE